MIKKLGYSVVVSLLLSSTAPVIANAAPDLAAQNLTFDPAILAEIETASGSNADRPLSGMSQDVTGFAGAYLASHFAQTQQDWLTSFFYLEDVLSKDTDNAILQKRAMVLAMGAGRQDMAARRAIELLDHDPENKLALIILAVDSMASGQEEVALRYLDQMPDEDIASYIKPLLTAWAHAAQGDFETDHLSEKTSLHSYHAGLISIFLDKNDKARDYAKAMIASRNIGIDEAVRAADLFAYLGDKDQAMLLYRGAYMQDQTLQHAAMMISALERKHTQKEIEELLPHIKVKNAAAGAAEVIYDLAYLMMLEQSTSSARLFAFMALSMSPNMNKAHLLLAETMAQAERFDEAIIHLTNIDAAHPSYLEAQRQAAELLADSGRTEEARERLNDMFLQYNDVESLIRIGDIYRRDENYNDALKAYNQAAAALGETVPEEYWHLLYARGMAYEREGIWQKAENDLKAALAYRPNHPYLLNYLGYGWADQGMNLDKSLELVKRAVMLQPADGYIIDSLGWIQYIMGDFESAIATLERAVELLPYDSTINDHLGDAYWSNGRKLEARFQWKRALNYARDSEINDEALMAKIEDKLANGLAASDTPQSKIKQAHNETTVTTGDIIQ
jgi:tetratricopeptide (TPR) repeat protein